MQGSPDSTLPFYFKIVECSATSHTQLEDVPSVCSSASRKAQLGVQTLVHSIVFGIARIQPCGLKGTWAT